MTIEELLQNNVGEIEAEDDSGEDDDKLDEEEEETW